MTAIARGLGLLVVLLPGALSALTLTYLDQERGVVSETLAAEASDFVERYDPAESSDFLPFGTPVSSAATTAIASAVAEASLVSALEPSGLSAIGSVSATATTTALDARGRAPANSFFELLFQVDATGDVPIAGRVQAANGGAEGDAWASVELVEVVGGATLVSYEAAPGADILFDESVALQANTTYRLTAQSLAYAQASQIVESSTGSASYAIAVPEPSLGIQFIVSCVLVFGLRLRRRWSPRIDRRSTPSRRGPR